MMGKMGHYRVRRATETNPRPLGGRGWRAPASRVRVGAPAEQPHDDLSAALALGKSCTSGSNRAPAGLDAAHPEHPPSPGSLRSPPSPAKRARVSLPSGLQSGENRRENAVEIFHDLVVPIAQHPPSVIFEPLRSHGIGSAVRVLAAIDLDDQRSIEADKVDDIWPQRTLPSELEPAELAVAQCRPKPALGSGQVYSEVSDKLIRHLSDASTRGWAGAPTLTRLTAFGTLSRQAGEGLFAAIP